MQEPRPKLARGRHKTSGHEACVMELVSLLNGEKWSDHPQCVQPVLAAVARAVNDRIGDEGRERLIELAPRLAGTATVDWLVSARLVVRCTGKALRLAAAQGQAGRLTATGVAEWRGSARRMSHEAWQELTDAGRTARYLVSRQAGTEPAPCPWRVRAGIWALERVGLFKRVYTYDAELQVAFAIAQLGGTPDAEPELLALLEACITDCHPDHSGGRVG